MDVLAGDSALRTIAFYLPQFHPIPENDLWWGKGFTEWTNVTKETPRFSGHLQPRLPTEMGFYDLRVPEVMEEQAALARDYGISGFCFYHYWFNGRLILEKPLHQMLRSGRPDFPYCLCWANENWSRRWNGGDTDLLMTQQYSVEDDLAHFHYLLPFFQDSRYIRIDGKPVMLVYRTEQHPHIVEAAKLWRDEARKAGLQGLYLVRVEGRDLDSRPEMFGFDASVEFMPVGIEGIPHLRKKKRDLRYYVRKWLHRTGLRPHAYYLNSVLSLEDVSAAAMAKPEPAHIRFRCIAPSWDNSARRKENARIYVGGTPEHFYRWARWAIRRTIDTRRPEERLLFINAWNEWAEGCVLEPCRTWGRGYLESFHRALVEENATVPRA